jgi:uncharacterized protein (TIGR04222 family)
MEAKDAQLLQRIEEFSLDAPDAAYPFSARLAKENQWSAEFARRALVEYKRFVFLAMVAGHPVSPSDAVDQVWHLHLTYTQSYWKQFCGEVLQRPFHHQPTKGGMDEHAKFEDWYTRTLASYRKFFREEPPADIWPDGTAPAKPHPEYVRVDVRENWVIPKVRLPWLRHAKWAGYAAGLALLAAGCRSASGGWKSPFDLSGPDFLLFYVVLMAGVLVAAAFWRRALRDTENYQPPSQREPDGYELAYLNGGEALAVNAAVVSLAQQKVLKVTGTPAELAVTGELSAEAHPLERAVVTGVGSSLCTKLAELRPALEQPIGAVVEAARRQGWALTEVQQARARWWPALVALVGPVIGIIKVMVGLHRDRPVALLLMLVLASLVAIGVLIGRRPRTTRAGDELLRRMRERYATMRGPAVINSPATPAMVPLALGLFGLAVLADTSMADMRKNLGPPPGSSGCGSSCGSSGGGSSCGGSSGCGGCGGGGGD